MAGREIGVGVVGAAGRMGQRVMALIAESEGLALRGAVDTPAGVASLASDLWGVAPSFELSDAAGSADVVIDFSAPPVASTMAGRCAEQGVPYLLASTGLTPADEAAVSAAAERVAVLKAANLSVGINVLRELVALAAERLGAAFDVELVEMHHRHKRDAPSGTARTLAAAIEQGRGPLTQRLGRSGVGEARPTDELGIVAVRGGDVTGEHTVLFLGDGERVELVHRATTRDIFARGALRAAQWLRGKPAGLYSMADVLRA